jgi:hypothetical protein
VSETLARVEEEATQLLAANAEGIEGHDLSTGGPVASALKQAEAIFESAVHHQVVPLNDLIADVQAMISLQYQHLARIKSEAELLLLNGERASAVVSAVRAELADMRSRHAAVVNGRTGS